MSGSPSEKPPAVISLGSWWGPRGWGLALLLFFLALFIPAESRAQTLGVYDAFGQEVNTSGNFAEIDPGSLVNWPMPDLTLGFFSLSKGDRVDYYVTMDYVDDANPNMNGSCAAYSTNNYATCLTTQTYAFKATSCSPYWVTLSGSSWGIGAQDESEGGYATVYWSVNGTDESPFYFDIGGTNYSSGSQMLDGAATSVDGYYGAEGAPWFFGNILEEESVGDQYCTSTTFYCTKGFSNVNNDPDGIGMAQVDGMTSSSYVNDYVYWNFEGNIVESLSLLSNKATGNCSPGTCAYPFWDNQVQQMCTWTGGTYSNASAGEGECTVVQQPNTGAPPTGPTYAPGSDDYYTPQSLPNCASHFTLSDNDPSGWRDAELIKAYNGASPYYIFWHPDYNDPTQYQYWVFNNYSGTTDKNYVYNVCTAADY